MVQEKITGERRNSVPSEQNPSGLTHDDGGAENMGGSLIDKAPGNVRGNPEFAKWWKRWVYRVHRIGLKRNLPARRVKLGRRDETTHGSIT